MTYFHNALLKHKREHGREGKLPVHTTARMEKTNKEHGNTINQRQHDACKAGFTTTGAFIVKLKFEINELSEEAAAAKANKVRARKKAIKGAMANTDYGMRRAYAAARQPPQKQLTAINWNNRPRITPDEFGEAYDQNIGTMFRGVEGGMTRSLARAALFVEKYVALCPRGEQYKIPTISGIAVHRTIKGTSSIAPSFDNIYRQEVKHLPMAHAEWFAKMYQIIEEGAAWPKFQSSLPLETRRGPR